MQAKAVRRVIDFAKNKKIEVVDFRFADLLGRWQHFSVPREEIEDAEGIWVEGIGFDGSSVRGFQKIHESDTILIPDPTRFFVDPVLEVPTLAVICSVFDPLSRQPHPCDPRYVAKKAEDYLVCSKIADKSYWGPEIEFFIFDEVRFSQEANFGYYFVDSAEGEWNSGKEENPNLGYKLRYKEGYFPVPPHDTLQDIRSELMRAMIACGIPIEVHHHEVASGGQCELDMRYDTLVRMADNVCIYKYLAKNIARKYGKVATFMPKPLFGDNGSGMHTHQSLWKNGTPLFYDEKGYAFISEVCRHYIGGLLAHSAALLAFCAPTTNSYRRLVPGYEAPVALVYGKRNRSAAIRIPMYSSRPETKRIEYRPPDPSCNAYLAFSAMLMAGLDGVRKSIDPGLPCDENIYELSASRMSQISRVPDSLEKALDALEEDYEFLLEGGVFTNDLLETWIELRRAESREVHMRPHPYEFRLFFDG